MQPLLLLATVLLLAPPPRLVAATGTLGSSSRGAADQFPTRCRHATTTTTGPAAALREEVRAMFQFGYDSYMRHAYPMDELNPLQCTGRGPDRLRPDNININDVLGNFSMTLIDTLDTHVVLGNVSEFHRAAHLVMQRRSFDIDSLVSVFEVTIRVLGGLLSAHVATTHEHFRRFWIPGYKNQLLRLAHDLGKRLLPAFENTRTGLPYPRVNLRYGVPPGKVISQTCTAGAGTLLLEFASLSRFTGDDRFEAVAKRAMLKLWNLRSNLDLVGNVIDIQTGQWLHVDSGVGAGIDSFFEYALKSHVLLGDQIYLDIFGDAYEALNMHVRDDSKYIYRNVNMATGVQMSTWMDSLGAFLPGLQVLFGDVVAAERGHEIYFALWRKYGALPERFDFVRRDVNVPLYPLRPELAESTYMLYRATRDPYYLAVGEVLVHDLQRYSRVQCGYATLQNVVSKSHEDRMESFFLSETLKYLYLLFDEDNSLNHWDGNWVFSTEGHIMHVPPKRTTRPTSKALSSKSAQRNNFVCPLQPPLSLSASWATFGTLGMRAQHHEAISKLVGFEGGIPIDDVHQRSIAGWTPTSAFPVPVPSKTHLEPLESPPPLPPRFCRSDSLTLAAVANNAEQARLDPATHDGKMVAMAFSHGARTNIAVNGRSVAMHVFTQEGLDMELMPDNLPQTVDDDLDWATHWWAHRTPDAWMCSVMLPLQSMLFDWRSVMSPCAAGLETGGSYAIVRVNGILIEPKMMAATLITFLDRSWPSLPTIIQLRLPNGPSTDPLLELTGLPAIFSRAACEIPDTIEGPLVVLQPPYSFACDDDSLRKHDLRGRVVLLQRGTCSFEAKVRRAVQHGAVAVLIANDDNTLFHMGKASNDGVLPNDGILPNDGVLPIPAVLISLTDARHLQFWAAGSMPIVRLS